MNDDRQVTVTVKRHFKVSPERVFDAWLDPNKARRFLFTDPSGEVIRCEIEPRVGGKFIIVDRRATGGGKYTGDIEHTGEYLEIDRPRHLVFTFSVPKYSPLATQVSIDIVPTHSGCELTLTHTGVLPDYEKDTHTGWNTILDGLAAVITGQG